MAKQQQQQQEEQPLVGPPPPPPVKRGRGRPRKVPPLDGGAAPSALQGCQRPSKVATATTNKCSVRITASEREIAEAKEAVRENGADDCGVGGGGPPVDSKGVSLKVVTPPPPQSLLPPHVKVLDSFYTSANSKRKRVKWSS